MAAAGSENSLTKNSRKRCCRSPSPSPPALSLPEPAHNSHAARNTAPPSQPAAKRQRTSAPSPPNRSSLATRLLERRYGRSPPLSAARRQRARVLDRHHDLPAGDAPFPPSAMVTPSPATSPSSEGSKPESDGAMDVDTAETAHTGQTPFPSLDDDVMAELMDGMEDLRLPTGDEASVEMAWTPSTSVERRDIRSSKPAKWMGRAIGDSAALPLPRVDEAGEAPVLVVRRRRHAMPSQTSVAYADGRIAMRR